MIVPHLSLIKTINHESLFTVSKVRQFTIKSDEPITNKGTDLGPSPFDLLNASLASCTVIFLRLFAQKHNKDVGEIYVKIKIKHDEDNGFLFERTISFEKVVTENDIKMFEEAVKETPVTKIILSTQKIATKVITKNFL